MNPLRGLKPSASSCLTAAVEELLKQGLETLDGQAFRPEQEKRPESPLSRKQSMEKVGMPMSPQDLRARSRELSPCELEAKPAGKIPRKNSKTL